MHILQENFSYPFQLERIATTESLAMVAENDTSKELKTHKIFFRNSNVCLENDWWKPQKAVTDSI
jgi:hypothetical protein